MAPVDSRLTAMMRVLADAPRLWLGGPNTAIEVTPTALQLGDGPSCERWSGSQVMRAML